MDSNSLLRLIYFGLWVPLFSLLITYLAWKFYLQRMNVRRKYYSEMREKDMSEERFYRLEREISRIQAMYTEVDGLSKELRNEIKHDLSNDISKIIDDKLYSIQKLTTQEEPRSEGTDSQQNEILIREISHSLNTPLSQIEASILAISSSINSSETKDEQLSQDIISIQSSLSICKSFLAAYRELVLVAKSAKLWEPKSIKNSLMSAFNLYKKNSNKTLDLKLEFPDTITGYTNNYIISLLLPLIENAIEASIDNSHITIKSNKSNGSIVISISNSVENNEIGDEIYADGYSTKNDHDGMGLSIVKHLLSSNAKTSLSHSIKNGGIEFKITLPSGE